MAPEILLGQNGSDPKLDVWSMGVMLYAMVLGHYPFENKEDKEALRSMIINKEIKIPRRGQVNRMVRRKSKLDSKDLQVAA